MTKEALDMLFKENVADQKKNQSYKDNFKEYELPDKYFLLEMYNKQKELQTFLAERGKTEVFPQIVTDVIQPNVQLAIYHLFCMQIEFNELKVELNKLSESLDDKIDTIDARYELIDMFFFMFNVGIYTGLDMMAVVNRIDEFTKGVPSAPDQQRIAFTNVYSINFAIEQLMNYIDKLPWKAWKEYDLSTFDYTNPQIIEYYASAVNAIVEWAKEIFGETDKSLFDLYMNKWEENRRRQIDINSGYILASANQPDYAPTGFPGDGI